MMSVHICLSVCLSVCVFVCLSGSISPKLHIQSPQFFRHDIFHRGSVLNSGGVAIRYVFPVFVKFLQSKLDRKIYKSMQLSFYCDCAHKLNKCEQ